MIDERMLKKAVLNSTVFRKTRKNVTEALASNPSYILVLSFLPSFLPVLPLCPASLSMFAQGISFIWESGYKYSQSPRTHKRGAVLHKCAQLTTSAQAPHSQSFKSPQSPEF